jgi:hypothetical protein
VRPRVVRDRQPGVPPVTALHRHFRAGLDRYDPVTGLNDHPEVLAFHRLVFTTPSLAGRLTRYMLDDEEALAGALGPASRHDCRPPRCSRSNGYSPGLTGRKSPPGERPATSTPRLSPTPARHSLNCSLEAAALLVTAHRLAKSRHTLPAVRFAHEQAQPSQINKRPLLRVMRKEDVARTYIYGPTSIFTHGSFDLSTIAGQLSRCSGMKSDACALVHRVAVASDSGASGGSCEASRAGVRLSDMAAVRWDGWLGLAVHLSLGGGLTWLGCTAAGGRG